MASPVSLRRPLAETFSAGSMYLSTSFGTPNTNINSFRRYVGSQNKTKPGLQISSVPLAHKFLHGALVPINIYLCVPKLPEYLKISFWFVEQTLVITMCVSCMKNMNKMTSVLLMLVLLAVSIHSSQALKCYQCIGCDEPTSTTCEYGDMCIKVVGEVAGEFAIH